MFFALDGVDGAGKSTQLDRFVAWLRQRVGEVVTCRDPGSTALGEQLRHLLLTPAGTLIERRAEMLLYMAARAQLVDEVIRPALDAGRAVVADRFLLANVVYQGHAGGLDPAAVWAIGSVATQGIEPDLNIVLDLDERAAAERMQRPLDRIEQRGAEYRAAVRQGFLTEAARRPEQIVIIDGSESIEAVELAIQAAVCRRCPQLEVRS